MPLGASLRSDAQIVSMPFTGTKPAPGDEVKLTTEGKVEIATANTDTAYGVVTFYDNNNICAVVTHGHVLAKLSSPTIGATTFGILAVVRKMNAIDATGAASSDGYEVKVG